MLTPLSLNQLVTNVFLNLVLRKGERKKDKDIEMKMQ
jgi:hypothetical protein